MKKINGNQLRDINFFVGPNGSGKSTEAEAQGFERIVCNNTEEYEPEIRTCYKFKRLKNEDFEEKWSKKVGTTKIIDLIRKVFASASNKIWLDQPERCLYPHSQSTLCDLIWEMHLYTGKQFIIETHSEYLMRKGQVYVKTFCESFGELDEVPFGVFWFSKDKEPRNMEYTESGRFKRLLGSGLYDVAARLSFTVGGL